MSHQLPLPISDRVRISLEKAAEEIRAELRTIAKRTKQGDILARSADLDAGNLSKALKGERNLDVSSLPAFFLADDAGGLIRLLCRLNRGQFVPDPELTAEVRLENVLRACRRSGAAGEAILRDAGEET
ncbi:hypothetical protein [Anaeromyxobacter oryzisoli]|uniref:hypothetical protein n=1 Tax=Anaeromyxobacter oryzisoli TaxID=2925408 RepID=UPI001F5A67E4|nr:hypothetical protein [Anaeromyxobacter sp. SG63]